MLGFYIKKENHKIGIHRVEDRYFPPKTKKKVDNNLSNYHWNHVSFHCQVRIFFFPDQSNAVPRSFNFWVRGVKFFDQGYLLLGASLVVQWLRIRLPMQGSRVRSLVREDPTCRGATKLMRHNYWACAVEPASHNYWARAPTTRAPQQEKPPQWEARTPQQRVGPALRN